MRIFIVLYIVLLIYKMEITQIEITELSPSPRSLLAVAPTLRLPSNQRVDCSHPSGYYPMIKAHAYIPTLWGSGIYCPGVELIVLEMLLWRRFSK